MMSLARGLTLLAAAEHSVLRQADHQFAAVVLPRVARDGVGLVADRDGLGLARGVALAASAVGEPEVVDHDLVEEPRRVLEDRLEVVLGLRVGVAGDAVPAGRSLADLSRGHAAGDLESGCLEALLGVLRGPRGSAW